MAPSGRCTKEHAAGDKSHSGDGCIEPGVTQNTVWAEVALLDQVAQPGNFVQLASARSQALGLVPVQSVQD